MKPVDLPRLGEISNSSDGEFFGEWTDLTGKNLLCLGMSEDQIDRFVSTHRPNSIDTLVYWEDHIDAQRSKYRLTLGDITKRTDFEDNQFDAVLSLSVLEHVSDIGAAFDEMARITKHRGEMLHMFGPAWSCAYGHHLYVVENDPNLNFVKWQMPAHMHLLCDETEICDYYLSLGYHSDYGRMVFNQFQNADFINRAFYDDYVEVMSRYQVDRVETMYNWLPADHLEMLRDKFPGKRDFSTYGGRYRLMV